MSLTSSFDHHRHETGTDASALLHNGAGRIQQGATECYHMYNVRQIGLLTKHRVRKDGSTTGYRGMHQQNE
jgi:hypothetical protein